MAVKTVGKMAGLRAERKAVVLVHKMVVLKAG
jgi:hypothetical protein